MRLHKLEENLKGIPKKEREKLKRMIKNGEFSLSQGFIKKFNRKGTKSLPSSQKNHRKKISHIEPQMFDSDLE